MHLPAWWDDARLREALRRPLTAYELRRAAAWRREHELRGGRYRTPEAYRAYQRSFDEGVHVARQMRRMSTPLQQIRPGVRLDNPGDSVSSIGGVLDVLRAMDPRTYGDTEVLTRHQQLTEKYQHRFHR